MRMVCSANPLLVKPDLPQIGHIRSPPLAPTRVPKMRDEKIAFLQAERERERKILQDGVDDLRHRLDQSEEERRKTQAQLTALLTDQRPDRRRRWWPWG